MNPSSGKVIGSVPDMGAVDAEGAIKAANNAFQTWRHTTAKVCINNMGRHNTQCCVRIAVLQY